VHLSRPADAAAPAGRQGHVLDAFRESELHWDLAVLEDAYGHTADVNGRGYLNKKS